MSEYKQKVYEQKVEFSQQVLEQTEEILNQMDLKLSKQDFEKIFAGMCLNSFFAGLNNSLSASYKRNGSLEKEDRKTSGIDALYLSPKEVWIDGKDYKQVSKELSILQRSLTTLIYVRKETYKKLVKHNSNSEMSKLENLVIKEENTRKQVDEIKRKITDGQMIVKVYFTFSKDTNDLSICLDIVKAPIYLIDKYLPELISNLRKCKEIKMTKGQILEALFNATHRRGLSKLNGIEVREVKKMWNNANKIYPQFKLASFEDKKKIFDKGIEIAISESNGKDVWFLAQYILNILINNSLINVIYIKPDSTIDYKVLYQYEIYYYGKDKKNFQDIKFITFKDEKKLSYTLSPYELCKKMVMGNENATKND